MSEKRVRLKDITELITKGTTPTTLGFNFTNHGIAFLRVQNIEGGKVDFDQAPLFIDELTHNALKRSHINSGDVLISIAGSIGRSAIVPENAPKLNCNQAVAIIRTKNNIFKPFLRHWLESLDAQSQMRSSTVTGTISNLSLSQLGDLRVPLPPIAEQKRIAAILDKAEEIRSQRRQALEQLDTIRQSIFLEMFGDPVSNPKKWSQLFLSDIVIKITDGEHLNPQFSLDSMPIVMAGNVLEDFIDLRNSKKVETQLGHRFRKKCNPEKGDILLVSRGATIGRLCTVNSYEEFCLMGSVILIKLSNSVVESKYLECLLKHPSMYSKLFNTSGSSAQQAIYLKDLKTLKCLLPPLPLQQEFARRVEAIAKLKATHRESLAQLDALFASLQHRAFRGDL